MMAKIKFGNVSNPHKLHFYIGEYGRSKLHHLLSNSSPFSATKNKNKPHRKKGARVPLALGTSFGHFQNPLSYGTLQTSIPAYYIANFYYTMY